MKIFSSIRKCVQFLFQLYSNCICMPIIVSEFSFSKKSSDLKIIWCYPQFYHTYVRWKSCFIQKYLHLLFQLYFNCIWMPIIVPEIFLRKSSFLSLFLCSNQLYHTYVRGKSLVLSENVSFFFLNCILIVFVNLPMYLRIFAKQSSIFKIILSFLQFDHIYIRGKSSVL